MSTTETAIAVGPIVATGENTTLDKWVRMGLHSAGFEVADNLMKAFMALEDDDTGERVALLVKPLGVEGRQHTVQFMIATVGDFKNRLPVSLSAGAWKIVARSELSINPGLVRELTLSDGQLVIDTAIAFWNDYQAGVAGE